MASDAGKLKVIETAMIEIEKTYGKGSIMNMGSTEIKDIPVISSGNIKINAALGVGGFPRGRITEVYGPESSGKTTLCLHVMAEAIASGGQVAFIDAEHALDMKYAQKLGVHKENLFLSQPDYGEQALEITETLVRTNAFDVIVVDSVAALVPRSEIEGDMGDAQMGLQARLMSQAMRKLTGLVASSNTVLIFVNQLRSKIGVVFGSPETTTGGNALKFYATIRIDIRRVAAIKTGDNITGNETKVKIVKNKVAPPFKVCQVKIMYGMGISKLHDIFDHAVDLGIFQKGGAWYTYGEMRFNGMAKAIAALSADPMLYNEVTEKVLAAVKVRDADQD